MLHQCHCYVPCTHKKNIHIYKPRLIFPPACMQHQCDIRDLALRTFRESAFRTSRDSALRNSRNSVLCASRDLAPLGTRRFTPLRTQCFAPLGTRCFVPLGIQCFVPPVTRHFVPLGTQRCECPTQSETCYALCLALQEKYEQNFFRGSSVYSSYGSLGRVV